MLLTVEDGRAGADEIGGARWLLWDFAAQPDPPGPITHQRRVAAQPYRRRSRLASCRRSLSLLVSRMTPCISVKVERLGQHFADDMAMHVGESEVAAGEVVG